jgi:hypothetical protein
MEYPMTLAFRSFGSSGKSMIRCKVAGAVNIP